MFEVVGPGMAVYDDIIGICKTKDVARPSYRVHHLLEHGGHAMDTERDDHELK